MLINKICHKEKVISKCLLINMYHFVPIDFIPISQIFLHHLKYITKILIDSYVKISDKNY